MFHIDAEYFQVCFKLNFTSVGLPLTVEVTAGIIRFYRSELDLNASSNLTSSYKITNVLLVKETECMQL